jgi:hypothetical protein
MKLVPLYDGNENVGSGPLIANLDTWDGHEVALPKELMPPAKYRDYRSAFRAI